MIICFVCLVDDLPAIIGEFVNQRGKWVKGKSLFRPYFPKRQGVIQKTLGLYPKRAEKAKKGGA